MFSRVLIILFFIILTTIGSCVDRIDLTLDEPVIIPVVDGFITDEYGLGSLRLSYTIQYSNEKDVPIENAVVTITDDQGNVESLKHRSEGRYSKWGGIQAQQGRSYKLRIELPDGSILVSDFQKLPKSQETCSLSYQETIKTEIRRYDEKLVNSEGIDLIATIDNVKIRGGAYYMFEVYPTWLLISPLATDPDLKYCYFHDNNTIDISVAEEKPEAYDYPIEFYPYDIRFDNGISFQVVQYSISKESYEFWQKVKKQIEYDGSIFSTPPVNAGSNVKYLNNPNGEVSGFFGVYSASYSRIFVSRDLYDKDKIIRDHCYFEGLGKPDYCYRCTEWREWRRFVSDTKPEYWPD